MSATQNQQQEFVRYLVNVAGQAVSLKSVAEMIDGKNNALAVDWNTVGNTLIEGTDFTGTEVSNMIGSLEAFFGAFWATHGGNFEKLAKPTV